MKRATRYTMRGSFWTFCINVSTQTTAQGNSSVSMEMRDTHQKQAAGQQTVTV